MIYLPRRDTNKVLYNYSKINTIKLNLNFVEQEINIPHPERINVSIVRALKRREIEDFNDGANVVCNKPGPHDLKKDEFLAVINCCDTVNPGFTTGEEEEITMKNAENYRSGSWDTHFFNSETLKIQDVTYRLYGRIVIVSSLNDFQNNLTESGYYREGQPRRILLTWPGELDDPPVPAPKSELVLETSSFNGVVSLQKIIATEKPGNLYQGSATLEWTDTYGKTFSGQMTTGDIGIQPGGYFNSKPLGGWPLWIESNSYKKYDIVTYNGKNWEAVVDISPEEITPDLDTNHNTWKELNWADHIQCVGIFKASPEIATRIAIGVTFSFTGRYKGKRLNRIQITKQECINVSASEAGNFLGGDPQDPNGVVFFYELKAIVPIDPSDPNSQLTMVGVSLLNDSTISSQETDSKFEPGNFDTTFDLAVDTTGGDLRAAGVIREGALSAIFR